MKDAKITFRLSEADKASAEATAAARDIPLAQLIREALRKELNKGEKENE